MLSELVVAQAHMYAVRTYQLDVMLLWRNALRKQCRLRSAVWHRSNFC